MGLGQQMDKTATSQQKQSLDGHSKALGDVGRAATAAARPLRAHASATEDVSRKSRSASSALKELGQVANGLGTALKVLAIPAIVAGLGVLVQMAGTAGAGILAFAGSVGTLSGALVAVPQLLTGLVQGFAGVAAAFGGVGGAIGALKDQQKSAGKDAQAYGDQQRAAANGLRQAAQGVTDANVGLVLSLQSQKDAQEGLTQANRDAVRQLTDVKLAALGAALGQRGAAIALERAKADLVEAQLKGSDLDTREATLGVDAARLALRQSRVETNRTRTDARRVLDKGVGQSQQVVAAQRGLAAANRGVEAANRGVADAHRAMQDAVRASQRLQTEGAAGASAVAAAFKNLSPEAAAFARHIVAIGPQFRTLRAAAGKDLFPGLTVAVNRGLKLLPMLRTQLRQTGNVAGRNAKAFAGEMTTTGRQRDLSSLMSMNNEVFDMALKGVRNLTSALIDVLVAAEPFNRWLFKSLEGFTVWTKNAAKSGRETGKLAKFLDHTKENLQVFGSVIRNTWRIVVAVLTAATPLGDDLGRSSDALTGRAARWTESTEGMAKMTAYFNSQREPIRQLVGLFGDLFKALFRISTAGDVTKNIKGVRGLVGPVERFVTALSGEFATVALASLGQIFELLATMTAATGPLTIFAEAVGLIAKGFNTLLTGIPGLSSALAALFSVALLNRFIKRLAAATGMLGRFSRASAPGMPGVPGAPGGGGGGGTTILPGSPGGGTRVGAAFRAARAGPGGGVRAGARAAGTAAAGIGVGGLAKGGAKVAAKFAGPVAALMAAFDFASAEGNVGERTGSAVNAGTFGLTGALGDRLGVNLRGKKPKGEVDAAAQKRTQAFLARSGTDNKAITGRAGHLENQLAPAATKTVRKQTGTRVGVGRGGMATIIPVYAKVTVPKLDKDARARIKAELATLRPIANAAGASAGAGVTEALKVRLNGGQGLPRVMKAFRKDFTGEFAGASRGARWAMAKHIAGISADLSTGSKRQRRIAAGMANQIESTYRRMGQRVRVVNGRILTGSEREWEGIAKAMINPAEKARQEVAKSFTAIQKQAIGSLEAMGYDKKSATTLINMKEKGGGAAQVAQNIMNIKTPKAGARGMRIAGAGLRDTVKVAPGHLAAPGELIVNRHTERRIGQKYGVNLGAEVAGETRKHSEVEFARGGRVGANLMGANPGLSVYADKGARFGLQVTSGKRVAGGRTASGGISQHGSGDALDISGPATAMLSFARDVVRQFGNEVDQIIHTPMGFGMSHGQRVTSFGAEVDSGHYDHVHIGDSTPPGGRGKGGVSFGVGGGADGGGGPAALMPALKAKPSRARGIAGAMSNAAQGAIARGLTSKINEALAASGGGGGGGGAPSLALGGGSAGKRIFDYFRGRGFTAAQAAAWVGNFQQESGLNPAIVQPGGEGHGLAQWGGGRFAALQSFAAGRKKPWQDMQTQLDFVWKELQGSEGRSYGAIKGSKSIAAATSAIATQYERAGIIGNRTGPAQDAYRRYALATGGRVTDPSFAGWFKGGGKITAKRPTLVGIGESGGTMETATVTRGGSTAKPTGGGARGVQIGSMNITVQNHREGDVTEQVRREIDVVFKELAAVASEERDGPALLA